MLAILREMQSKMDDIENLLIKLDKHEGYEDLKDIHKEYYSIEHCVRWGNQAILELIEEINQHNQDVA